MACTAIILRPAPPGLPATPSTPPREVLNRLRRQENAARRASFWDCAARRALDWSRIWNWPCSPHVTSTLARHSLHSSLLPSAADSITSFSASLCLFDLQVIELGEDLLSVIACLDRSALIAVASTCRCLRGLLLPRIEMHKERAVRDVYLSL